ncbi:MAG: glycosyltransferase family 2 protein [Bacteroidales bacterium]|nr:glycosyltransferase family 2 protein [Bacteroidales bacterium]
MALLSVIVPSYNEELMVAKAASTISSVLFDAGINYELIFVDDGSSDTTWKQLVKISDQPHISAIHFSRNFGKEAAIYAGLSQSKGDCAVVIDCDLQHPPQKIIEMYHLWEDGYEVVEAVKTDRGSESAMHRWAAKSFYSIISKVTHIDMSRASDFKLLDRKAVLALLNMEEKQAFFRALSSWIGFKTTQVEFDVQEREAGESKWSTWSLVKYAVNNITSFSTAPMQIVTFLGGLMFVVMLVFGCVAIYQKIAGFALGGFTTVILLLLFIGSIVMMSLGIIGYYIAKIYDQVKGRPKYIISEIVGNV